MARMVPPIITDSTLSPGEREVFTRLRDDASTTDWWVLHAYDLARHQRAITGEIDFVIVIPGKGVLCLEVKAARQITRENGLWYYGRDGHGDPRGPFKQAADAMYSLRRRIFDEHPDLRRIVFWSAVIFPYVEFRDSSPEWHAWQVLDTRALHTRGIGLLLERVLDHAREHLTSNPHARWFDPSSSEPTTEQCERIVHALRGDFEFFESPRAALQRREAEVQRFTHEQISALDAMDVNPRVVFQGPAGTGKTVLAVEAARRASAAGKRVLLVCFNRMLGNALQEQTKHFGERVVATTLHHHMRMAAGLQEFEPSGPDFWQDELPSMAIDRLLARDDESFVFDKLIIDEAQDILRENYLDFLDLCLRGGLAAGRWRIFGDFDSQWIYSSADLSLQQFLEERGGNAPVYLLTRNCRNTPSIAALTEHLPGLRPVYSDVLRADDHSTPTVHFYRDASQQIQLLESELARLYQEGFSGQDIVVLSTISDQRAVASRVTQPPWRDRLCRLGDVSGGQIGYSTIHAFKGMEAPAVVITDLDHPNNPAFVPLLYVAITRARHRLAILAGENARPVLADTFR